VVDEDEDSELPHHVVPMEYSDGSASPCAEDIEIDSGDSRDSSMQIETGDVEDVSFKNHSLENEKTGGVLTTVAAFNADTEAMSD